MFGKRASQREGLVRRLLITLLLCSGIVAAMSPAQHSGFVSVRGKEIVAPDGSGLILRGINLGNWLVPEGYMFKFRYASSPRLINQVFSELIGPDGAREFWRTYRDNYVTRDDIRFIKSVGLNSLRVPFNYRLFTTEEHPDVWTGPGFELLDRVIRWCREEGLWVILDMHCAPGGQTGDNIDDSWGYPWLFESAVSRDRTVELWRRIAERYCRETTVAGYDLLNEPISTYSGHPKLNPLLEPLYKDIVAAIRSVDRDHLVFLGGAQWNSNFSVFGAPFDAQAVYTPHRYWSDTTQSVVQEFVDFRDRYNVPLWLGESGENTDRWISSFRRLLERNAIGWCFWPYKKMDATSCLVTFDRPASYRSVIAYADTTRASFELIRALRPDIDEVKRALDGFLTNCRFENCRVNEGYLRALGFGVSGKR
jgi:endoglucanase